MNTLPKKTLSKNTLSKVISNTATKRPRNTLFTGLILSLGVTLTFSQTALSHSRYILPSHTSLSGDEPEMVTLDLSVTNDIFHPDRSYGGKALEGQTANNRRNSAEIKVMISAPDGSQTEAPEIVNLGRKSATYSNLEQDGTYKMTLTTAATERTSYEKADGTRGRSNGLKGDIHLPDGSTNVQSYVSGSRVETFVTRNDLTETVLKPTNNGIELVGGTHPNDLFSGETIEFEFLMHGEPVAEGTEVLIVLGGTRHRNERAELNLTVDNKGMIEFVFPHAGFYFLEMSAEQEATEKGYDYDSYTYSATFEVWPE